MDVRLKRAYDPAEPADGHRVLIDRLWPRGVSRDRAKLDDWEKELSPSTELRQWFAHEPERFADAHSESGLTPGVAVDGRRLRKQLADASHIATDPAD